jgi:pimeloyl-ACP methyl ester carboxylesterase
MTSFVAAGAMSVGSCHGDRFELHSPIQDRRASRRRLVRGFAGGVAAGLLTAAGIRPAPASAGDATPASPHAEEGMESVIAPDGMRIAYRRAGDGPPLVLVHGTADDHTRWLPLLPALGERFTVYAIDRRGRGGSGSYDPATYRIEREFADVAAVVDAIGEPAHLLGHSFGALCSLEAALLTDRLRKLVLYEPPILIPDGEPLIPPEAVTKLEALLAAGDEEGVLLAFAREIVGVPEDVIAMWRAAPEWQASVEMAPTIVAEVRAVGDYVFDPARFRDLATPTLLLLGGESPPFFTVATEAVAAALPHDRLEVLPGQGHIAMDTVPELFLETVVGFLAEE